MLKISVSLLVVIAAGIALFLIWRWKPPGSFGDIALCSNSDEHCLREWLAATSGWAAAVVAIFTVLVIATQADRTARQQNEMMRFQAHEKLTLAEQVAHLAGNASGSVTQVIHEFDEGDNFRSVLKLQMYLNVLTRVHDEVERNGLAGKRLALLGNIPPSEARFETALPKCVEFLKQALAAIEDDSSEFEVDDLKRSVSIYLSLAHEDLRGIHVEATAFLKRWAHLAA